MKFDNTRRMKTVGSVNCRWWRYSRWMRRCSANQQPHRRSYRYTLHNSLQISST